MFERKSVIDEGLIRASLAEEAELRGNAAEHAVEKDVLEMASRLALSYKNIARIDNLTGFHALTNLCLDNNVITTMENMEHLTNLKWLDLSFNNITKIEGLEKLVHLQDLSLFGNQIETIEGLSQCTDLNCLSMGNNNIKEYDSIVYLREFRSLRLVNLKGNPICEDQDYKMFVIAHLKYITYLDYTLVEARDVITARELHQNHLMEFEEKEVIEEKERAQKELRDKQIEKLREANLDIVDSLMRDMEADDPDLEKLKQLPGLIELLEDYHEKVSSELEDFKVLGLEQHALRCKEEGDFDAALTRATKRSETRVVGLVSDFERKMKRATRDWYDAENEQPNPQVLRDLEAEGQELGATLRALEVEQLELFEKLVTEFEVRLGEFKTRNMSNFQDYFRKIEGFETHFHDYVHNLALELVEKLNSELDLLDHLPPETKAILAEKELLDVSIQGSYDIHLSKLLAQEELTGKRETAKFTSTIGGYRDDAQTRYRSHMAEINYFLAKNKEKVEKMIGELQLDEDNYD